MHASSETSITENVIRPLSWTGPKFLQIVQGHRVQLDKIRTNHS